MKRYMKKRHVIEQSLGAVSSQVSAVIKTLNKSATSTEGTNFEHHPAVVAAV